MPPDAEQVHEHLTNQDREFLNLLSIFHYVVGGIMALFGCFPSIYVVVGLALALGALADEGPGEPPPPALGWMIAGFAGCGILVIWSIAAAIIVAGRRLAAQRSYTFCLVVAALACLFMPFGTALGVFTIIVLMRPSVKQAFEARAANVGY